MPSSLKEAIIEAYATAQGDVAALDTLEISHSLVEDTIYIVANMNDLALTLEDSSTKTFKGVPWSLRLPPSGDNGLQSLQLVIDNVDPEKELAKFIDTVKHSREPVLIKYRPYLSNDFTQPQRTSPIVLHLTDVTFDLFQVSGQATFRDLNNRQFLTDLYTRRRFPSLAQ